MINAICWDMDGLIFNTEVVYRASWEAAAELQGVTIPDALYQDFVGRQDWECEQMLQHHAGGTLDMEQFKADRAADHQQRLTGQLAVKPGVEAVMQYALERGIAQALVTSSTVAEVERNFSLIGRADLLNYFKIKVTAESVQYGKPNPQCYRLACAQLGVEPEAALVLEDSHNGVTAGLAAGCQVVMVPDMIPPRLDLDDRVMVRGSLVEVLPLL